MASIIEAYDSTIKESFSGMKIILWAIPLSWFASGNKFVSFIVISVVMLMLVGFVVDFGHNVITKRGVIVPGVNLGEMFVSGVLASLALSPFLIIAWLGMIAVPLITLQWPIWDMTLKILICLFLLNLPITALAIYIRRKNILEVFNPKKFFQGFFEIFLSFTFFLIKMGLWTGLVLGFVSLLFSIFVGFNNSFWHYIIAMCVVAFLMIASNMVAQISEEIYAFKEAEEEKKRIQKAVEKLK